MAEKIHKNAKREGEGHKLAKCISRGFIFMNTKNQNINHGLILAKSP